MKNLEYLENSALSDPQFHFPAEMEGLCEPSAFDTIFYWAVIWKIDNALPKEVKSEWYRFYS